MSATERDSARALPLEVLQTRLLEILERDDEAAVSDAVDTIVSQGAYHGASDIHLEPWSDTYSVRFRIDGILQQVALLPQSVQPRLTARIKVLAELVVYRRDTPQDGRIDREMTSCGRAMRIATAPTIRGEKIVIRILGASASLYQLDVLGFPQAVVDSLRGIIGRSQGTLLLTGPSSSGKTTTIYALLRELTQRSQQTTNIVTIEDPVEYTLNRIAQMQVNNVVEFTFANALRSILRQDPEVIMVGEIRDQETANIAVRAGLTGHFVISTIHSGTAAGVFTRLLDMGIEGFLVASSISGVLAQRLVRLNCPECAQPYKPDPILVDRFDPGGRSGGYRRGAGCAACANIGYRGRASIGEMLEVDQEFAEAVLGRVTTSQLHELAVRQGMAPMAQDGITKARKGITTLEELARVLPT